MLHSLSFRTFIAKGVFSSSSSSNWMAWCRSYSCVTIQNAKTRDSQGLVIFWLKEAELAGIFKKQLLTSIP